jgi:hypothetical protein
MILMSEHGTLGQRAYEAYGDAVGWRNYEDKPMPAWIYLTDKVRDGWTAAAAKVAELVL